MRAWRWVGLAGVAGLFACGAIEMCAQTQQHARLIPQLGMSRVRSVAFSPDGRYVVTGSSDKIARLWDAGTGLELRSFAGHTDSLNSVAFSPDGRYVLTGSSDNTARLWDAATGQQLRSFEGHTGDVNSVAFSPDGRYVLTGSYDKTVRLWDVVTGQQLRSFEGHTAAVYSVAFSTDGRHVLTGSYDATARLWDVATGRQLRSFKAAFRGPAGTIYSAVFSPDARYVLTGCFDGSVRLWDVQTGQELRSFTGHTDVVYSVAFSPDGRYVLTGSRDETARLWDVRTGQQLRSFAGHTGEVGSVAFSRDGRYVLTGSYDATARIWNAATGQLVRSLESHAGQVNSVAFSPDGRYVLTGSNDDTARLWDAGTGQQVRSFAGHTDVVESVAFSPDGRYALTGGYEETARLWDVGTGQQVRSFVGQRNWVLVNSVAFSPDGRYVLTGNDDTTERLWDAGTGQQLRSFEGGDYTAFSPDGRYVLTGSYDKTARLWNAATGQQVRSFEGHTGPVYSVSFSPDGRYVLTGSSDKTARLWDAETGQQLRVFEGHTGPVYSVSFSPDGRYVLTGSGDTTTRLWDVETGRWLVSLISFIGGQWAVADPEGRFDTSDLDGGAPLIWVVDDDPMHALPLEIFMRDYYTPGLLVRVMKGEKLPEVRSIAEITNRVQPEVKVVSVTPSQKKTGRVDVKVHAASATDAKGVKSGLQDLRLFRDGQMVADGYREGTLKDGDFVFRDVMLKSDAKKVTFTAYALNSEKIKSATASLDYEPKTPGAVVKRRAFLLQVGVNHTMAQGCELKYSVNDAEAMSAALSEKLRAQGFEVEAVKLESPTHADGETVVMNGAPSKEDIREQLKTIAAKATPDDVFFMSFSGHGYSAAGGAFYVLPSDIEGSCSDAAKLKNMVSADELAEWLRPIDAGEMTLILDACYSAESVQAGDFKPGPMGSRGLGQVAYDKRMRVLAASQSDAVAHEYDYLHEGLLSYVLVQDGLGKDKADWKPQDGKITVGEWLSYAAAKVPEFKPAAPAGENKGTKVENTEDASKAAGVAKTAVQVPALFDFSRQDALVLAK